MPSQLNMVPLCVLITISFIAPTFLSAQNSAAKNQVEYSMKDLAKLVKHIQRVKTKEIDQAVGKKKKEWAAINKEWMAKMSEMPKFKDRESDEYKKAKADADAVKEKLMAKRKEWGTVAGDIERKNYGEQQQLGKAASQLLFSKEFSIGDETYKPRFVQASIQYGKIEAMYENGKGQRFGVSISLMPSKRTAKGKYLEKYPLIQTQGEHAIFMVNKFEVDARHHGGTKEEVEEGVKKAVNFENLEALK